MDAIRKKMFPLERKANVRFWVVILAALSMASLMLLALSAEIRQQITSQGKASLVRVCAQCSQRVESEISSRQRALRALAARLGQMEWTSTVDTVESLTAYCDAYGFYNLGVFKPDGVGYTTLDETFYVDFKQDAWFRQAMQGHQLVTESTAGYSDKQLHLNIFATPIYRDNEVIAVLTATYRSEEFGQLLNKGFFGGEGSCLIFNSAGMPVSTVREGVEADLQRQIEQACREGGVVLEARQDCQTFDVQGETYLGYTLPIGVEDWYVMGVLPQKVLIDEIRPLQIHVRIALCLLYFFVLFMAGAGIYTQRKLTTNLVKTVFCDELTHCYNFEYLKIAFQTYTEAQRTQRYLVVFDVDKLKFINILYGLKVGDDLLRYIVKIFHETLPGEEIYKDSADVFVAVLAGQNNDDVVKKIQKLTAEMSRRAEKGEAVPFVCSFGVCRMDKGSELRTVYDNALLAKRVAKHSMGKKYKFYDSVEEKQIHEREIEEAFGPALEHEEFEVWYQPKYDMREKRICGSEALVRWRRADGSLLPPGMFIPILEGNGRITELDEYVLRKVCMDLVRQEERGIPSVRVSVNLSKLHLQKPGEAAQIDAIVEEYAVDKRLLAFEITESATCDDKDALNAMVDELHRLGYKVDMDDYGTGSSTLGSLSSTNFNTLKLDKSFIDAIGTEKIDIILRSTIDMAQQLSMDLVAEGVETEEQAKFLLEHHCYVAQGYYFYRPMDLGSYEEALHPTA